MPKDEAMMRNKAFYETLFADAEDAPNCEPSRVGFQFNFMRYGLIPFSKPPPMRARSISKQNFYSITTTLRRLMKMTW